MQKFTIVTEITGKPRSIEFRVYDTQKQLRAACRRYASDENNWARTGGVYHPWVRVHIDNENLETGQPDAGIVRLCREINGGSVFVHEISHVAMFLYLVDYLERDEKALAIDHVNSHNEDFAYLIMELYNLAVIELYKLDFFTD